MEQERSSLSDPVRVSSKRRLLAYLTTGPFQSYHLAGKQLTRLLAIPMARTAMIAIAVFVIDCLTPLGIASGALYMAAVLSAVPIRRRHSVYATAAICSVLVLVGWVASPGQGQTEWWKVLTNRLVDLGIIWAAAGMAQSWNRLQQRRLRQVQEARLLHQATTLSASESSFREALENSLRTLCDILGWPVGHVYLRDADGRHLVSSDLWHTTEGGEFELLRAAARGLRFLPGAGIPGRVWEESEPIAVSDVAASPEYAWLKQPELLGVRGAFALPITINGKVAAVMEFFSGQPIDVDFEFMPLARNVGEQLGRLFERRRADQNLRRSEERLRLALEGGQMGIWQWEIDTGRVAWSPELEEMHGLAPGTFAGTREAVDDVIHPEDRPRVNEVVQRAVVERGSCRAEYRVNAPDGTVRWVEARGAVPPDSEGQPSRMIGVCMNITDRKQLEQQNARLAAVVESSHDAIVAKTLDGTILSWNLGAERIYGYTAAEVVGKSIAILIPDDQPSELPDIMQKIRRGDVIEHYETARRRKDGQIITISLSVSPVMDSEGNPIGASAIARDVTERKRVEQEMKEAREKAETANRLRSRFLANMSHELRTPMNSILGMLQLALTDNVTPEIRNWLCTAKASADSLLLLLDDLLDFSKIEADKLIVQYEPFRLRTLVEETARSLASRAFEKNLELMVDVAFDVPNHLVGDAGRIRQVLANLITNAIKFTEQGEVLVTVDLADLAPAEAKVRFAVADTGQGVSAEDQQRIFEPFIQSDATAARRQGGAGLGLAIATELTRRMGGQLHVESEPGEGSRFWFELPLPVEGDDDGMSPDKFAESLRDVPIILVDGNAASRDLWSTQLKQWSMRLDVAIDADHAMGKLYRAEDEQRAFRLLVADGALAQSGSPTLIERLADLEEPPAIILAHRPAARGPQPRTSLRTTFMEKPILSWRLLEALLNALNPRVSAEGSTTTRSISDLVRNPLSILLAEDTPTNQEVAAGVLRRRGHTVVVVENGLQAVQMLDERDFDIVLMDVTMPEMDGYEATAAIRQREREHGGHVPVIAMTAHATRDDHEKCVAAGMDHYLPKPIDVVKLVAMVEETAAKSNQHERSVSATEPLARSTRPDFRQESDDDSEIVDYSAALARLGGDTSLFQKIVTLFDEDAPELLHQIRVSATEGDTAELERAAHSLKGLAGNFGAQRAVRAAFRLEEMGKSGQIENAAEAIQELERQISRLSQSLAVYRTDAQLKPASSRS